jgi:hypothetical protein
MFDFFFQGIPMRWLSVLGVLLVVAPGYGQENDAEKLYRTMEKKVSAAKTLHVVCDGNLDANAKGSFKVTMDFAEGKIRVEMDFDSKKTLHINDGNMRYVKQGDKVQLEADKLDSALPSAVARLGIGYVAFGRNSSDPIDKWAPVKNFKVGAKEMVGQRQAQVVECQIDAFGDSWKMSVWIDTQTQLPLKRLLVLEVKGKTQRINENYSTFMVDTKLDPKLFDIPK